MPNTHEWIGPFVMNVCSATIKWMNSIVYDFLLITIGPNQWLDQLLWKKEDYEQKCTLLVFSFFLVLFRFIVEQTCMKRPICHECLSGHYKINELNHVQLFAHNLRSGPNKWLAATTYFLAVKTVLFSIHFKFSRVIYCSNHFAKTMSGCRTLKMYSADWPCAYVCTSRLMLPPW